MDRGPQEDRPLSQAIVSLRTLREEEAVTTDDANVYCLHPSESAPTPGYTQVVEATVGHTIYVSGQITPDYSDKSSARTTLRPRPARSSRTWRWRWRAQERTLATS